MKNVRLKYVYKLYMSKNNCDDIIFSSDKNMNLDIKIIKKLINKIIIKKENILVFYYDITILNNSEYKINDLALKDSLFSLKQLYHVIDYQATTTFENIIININNDNLLCPTSYIDPRQIARIMLKVSIKNEIKYNKKIKNIITNIYDPLIYLTGIVYKYNDEKNNYEQYKITPIIV